VRFQSAAEGRVELECTLSEPPSMSWGGWVADLWLVGRGAAGGRGEGPGAAARRWLEEEPVGVGFRWDGLGGVCGVKWGCNFVSGLQ